MKVRIHTDDFVLSGYENIRIQTLEDLSKLSKFDRGELDELIVDHVFDHIKLEELDDKIVSISELVKLNGGLLVVNGTDLYEVCKSFTNYNLDISDVNKVIFGIGDLPNRTMLTVNSLCQILKNNIGLRIIKKRMNGFTYSVEAQR